MTDLVLINWKNKLPELDNLKKSLKVPEVEELCLRRHAERSLISRSVLKMLLAERLKLRTSELELSKTENGKLYLKDSPWNFSLAHSGDFMAFAFHPSKKIGVDLETWDRAEQILRFAPRYFKARENNYIEKHPEKTKERALQIWTCKEAWLKAEDSTVFAAIEHREIPIGLSGEVESSEKVEFYFKVEPGVYFLTTATLN